jgi:hypothetical protein
MQPYRSHPHQPFRVSYGDERRNPMLVVGALLVIVVPIALFVFSFQSASHGPGLFVFVMPIGALMLLARRRGGSIEYFREEGELLVTARALLASHEDRVPVSDVTGLEIVKRGPRHAPDLVLQLRGDASLVLLRSPEEAELEAARATVQAFLDEHRLLPTAHLGEDAPEEDGDEDEGLDAREADQHR